MDNNQYLNVFIDEAREHLQAMNQNLIDLEQNPENHVTLDSLFRSAHTLKGMAATMGYQALADYTHKLENILDSFRQGEKKITSNIIDLLLEGADALEEFVNKLSQGDQIELDFSSMQEKLEHAFNDVGNEESNNDKQDLHNVEIAASSDNSNVKTTGEIKSKEIDLNEYESNLITSAKEGGYTPFYIRVTFDESVLLKGARAFMVFQKVESNGEIIKSQPEVEAIEDEDFKNQIELVVVTKESQEKLIEEITQISEIEDVEVAYLKAENSSEKEVNSNHETEEEKNNDEIQENNHHEPTEQKDSQSIKTGKTVRVDIERLDKLMNLVSELVINKTRLEQVAHNKETSELVKTSEQFSRITSEIQNVVMKVRMVPLEQVFNRFPRMVRDLSRTLDKDVNLIIEGKETELDRSLIDEIGDLLMHLIRNAIDHGLEDSETRKKLDKPDKGTVYIKAYHNENNVVIEVGDDGKGVNPDKIREKAIAKGLLDSQKSSQIPDSDVINYLFSPGFSTADEVSEVSGRGVGLDVVKSKIENLGGRVELDSEVNKGSKFTMQLPLTLAIIQALMVNVGDEQYALPLASIEETTILTKDDIKKVREHEVIKLRDSLVPLINLQDVLDVPNKTDKHEGDEKFAIIVRKGDKKAGLIVDELIGQQEVVIKSLGSFLADVKGFTGATILGDGKVALIIDINSMLF
ncbi:chemotaxis protein CheA [Natranaerobius trueperi]|uniref:Chemotaxis protein CheA n=1 Tax=Natranaerobius trueperi TaxID=759412 RepID=A0A226BZA2_9FIRM|nr:chemotaxis protein CheA [Natranaerobius trueperi]OWZ84251.1 chemotaxis protein CheA [Natranaerobius trueperi]